MATGGPGHRRTRQPAVGEPVEIRARLGAVFCGLRAVTPQARYHGSRPPFVYTHSPGHMFIPDVPDARYPSETRRGPLSAAGGHDVPSRLTKQCCVDGIGPVTTSTTSA